jgi:hypothetical protein
MQMEASGAMQVRNTKRERALRGLRRRGVIMIETMVGIAVISTTVLMGLVALSTASIATQQVSEGSTAGWVIVSQAELIRTLPYVNTGGSYTSVAPPTGFAVANTTSAYPGVVEEKQFVKVRR